MKDLQGKKIPTGDTPSICRRLWWYISSKCKKCGGKLKLTHKHTEHRKYYFIHGWNTCTQCGAGYSAGVSCFKKR